MSSVAIESPKLTAQELRSIQALAKGEADPGQQGMALQVIVKKFAQPSDLMYVPESPLDTAFLNGRGYVATLIRGAVNQQVEGQNNE